MYLWLVEFVGEICAIFASTADCEGWASSSCSCSVHSLSGSSCAGMRSQQLPCQGVQRKDTCPPLPPLRRPFRPHFTYFYRLVLTRSRANESRKATHCLAHLGRPTRSPAQKLRKIRLGGIVPPPAPPPAPLRGARLGYAQQKAPPSAEDKG
jgi:hypothetical protein